MVTNKIAESISARSTIGDLRRKCDKHEEDVKQWNLKTQMLQKVCSDLNTVMKRYILDVQNKQDNPTPIKITRSVGLQVCAGPWERFLHRGARIIKKMKFCPF